MAVTLPNGVVVPNADGREQISATGIDELRVAGASADSAIGAARSFAAAQAAQAEQKALDATQVALDVDTHSRARDAALGDQIAGMEGMTYVGAWEPGRTYRINDIVTHGGDSWARLTAGAAGEPGVDSSAWGLVARRGAGGGFGELSETDVSGLYETVDSGFDARLAALEYDTGWRDVSTDLRLGATGVLHIRRVGVNVHWRLRDFTAGTGHAFYWPADGLIAPPGAGVISYPVQTPGDTNAIYLDATGRLCRTFTAPPLASNRWWEGSYVLPPGTPPPASSWDPPLVE